MYLDTKYWQAVTGCDDARHALVTESEYDHVKATFECNKKDIMQCEEDMAEMQVMLNTMDKSDIGL
eukprot:5520465-Prorocentrum_lima.AAC.1